MGSASTTAVITPDVVDPAPLATTPRRRWWKSSYRRRRPPGSSIRTEWAGHAPRVSSRRAKTDARLGPPSDSPALALRRASPPTPRADPPTAHAALPAKRRRPRLLLLLLLLLLRPHARYEAFVPPPRTTTRAPWPSTSTAGTRSACCPSRAPSSRTLFKAEHAAHAERLVVLRVGDFYECYGVDAAVCVDVARTTPCGAASALRTSFRKERVARVLARLVRAGWAAAVYEESRVLVTPRQRVRAGRRRARPVYAHAPTSDAVSAFEGDDAGDAAPPDARPAVLVAPADHASWTVCACDVARRAVAVYAQVDRRSPRRSPRAPRGRAARARRAALCACAVRRGAVARGGGGDRRAGRRRRGAAARAAARLRARRTGCRAPPSASRRRAEAEAAAEAEGGGMKPTPRSTRLQPGIDDPLRATPSLVDAC